MKSDYSSSFGALIGIDTERQSGADRSSSSSLFQDGAYGSASSKDMHTSSAIPSSGLKRRRRRKGRANEEPQQCQAISPLRPNEDAADAHPTNPSPRQSIDRSFSLRGGIDAPSDYDLSIAIVDRHFRRAALGAVVVWACLVAMSFDAVPPDRIARLTGVERLSTVVAAVVLAVSCVSQVLPLLYRRTGGAPALSGIVLASIAVQGIAAVTDFLMGFFPSPVLIDPVWGTRVHLLRWCEWTPLAFLMTFVTEAADVPDPRRPGRDLFVPYAHAACQGLSTLCGLIFPFCPGVLSWAVTMVISFILFLVIFPRLGYKLRQFKSCDRGKSVEDVEMYERARLSLHLLTTCTVMWTALVVSYFVSSLGPLYAPEGSILKDPAATMVTECTMDVTMKVLYMVIIIRVHNAAFDEKAKAERRLEEIRQMMGIVWDNSSDVIGISVKGMLGTVTTMLSPSYIEMCCKGKSIEEKKINRASGANSISLAFDLNAIEFDHSSSQGSFRSAGLTHDETSNSNPPPLSKTVLTKRVQTVKFADLKPSTPCAGPNLGTNVKVKPALEKYEMIEEEMSSMVDIIMRAWHCEGRDSLLNHDLVLKNDSDTLTMRCEVKVTKLNSESLVIVIRDISERFRRFEAEKQVISETTARKKDAEVNRFTRHEVKNGLLAAIGLCDNLHEFQERQRSLLSNAQVEDPNRQQQMGSQCICAASSRHLEIARDMLRCTDELDNTLHEILDTILAEAMARDVIHGVYEPKLERVDITSILGGGGGIHDNCTDSEHIGRFPLVVKPLPLPLFHIDPQLLKYIHRNAISNGTKYGEKGGVVMTEVFFDDASGMLQMEVTNKPGEHHDEILALGKAAEEMVFRQGQRLHSHFDQHKRNNNLGVTHSSGDGAWIMKKCAQTLGGECDIKFKMNCTVFTLRCPALPVNLTKAEASLNPAEFQLPSNTWGIAIDDSKIQRKILERFFKFAGIEKDRCIIVGKDADEINGFDEYVVDFICHHPNDNFFLVVDENLDVYIDATHHSTVSGSMCVERIRKRLKPEEEWRTLALVRSANDSSDDIAIYNSRAHGFLPKAPLQKDRVREMLAAEWEKRYTASLVGPGGTEMRHLIAATEPVFSDDEEFEMLVSTADLTQTLEEISELLLDPSSTRQMLCDDWPLIWEKLHLLKGDLLTLPSSPSITSAVGMINSLRGAKLPEHIVERWSAIKSLVESTVVQ